MRFGYAKLGRSWNLDPANISVNGGDVDVRRSLDLLSHWYPEHEFVLVGRNSGEEPSAVGLPGNVTNPWVTLRSGASGLAKSGDAIAVANALEELTASLFTDLDGVIIWAGQHGTSNTPIPPVGKTWADGPTNPQISFVNYGSYLIRGINRWRDSDPWRRQEVWLCPDPRNYIKCRDLKWPHQDPILAQYFQVREQKHERYGDQLPHTWWNEGLAVQGRPAQVKRTDDGHVWVSQTTYEYSGLELTALPHPGNVQVNRSTEQYDFGIVINENRKNIKDARANVLREYVMPNWPACPIRGVWTDESKLLLGRSDIEPVEYTSLFDTLRTFVTTLTTPASGSGWATAKPWECFAVGTVCFFHPGYDTQGHIIPTLKQAEAIINGSAQGDLNAAHLAQWLRVRGPNEFRQRVQMVCAEDNLRATLVQLQRQHFDSRWASWRGGLREVERRLGLLT